MLRVVVIFFLAASAVAAVQFTPGQTILVIPFENQSRAPGLQWIGDSFPEILQERLTSQTIYVLTRADRLRAYDRLGVPANAPLSRATVYHVAEQMDVDAVVLGSYKFDGQTFAATAQVLDMRRARLLPEVSESGTLPNLLDVETTLAWDLLRAIRPDVPVSRGAFLQSAPAVRLDAFENYVRGIAASSADDQIRHYREALRLNPDYPEATLRLGEAYYRSGQYEQALSTLHAVSAGSDQAREANFYSGLAAYAKGDYDAAETAFDFVASRFPLSDVYNNLGAAQARRGKRSAVESFQKAVDGDPSDPDYRFNLAVALYRNGDTAGASRQLRQCLSLKPNDYDAKALLDAIAATATARLQQSSTATRPRIPAERIRKVYDEGSFRQLAVKVEGATEAKLAKTDPHTHALFLADRGREMLGQGFAVEAERLFREAIALDAASAEAHVGLARVLEITGDVTGARAEAETALHTRQFADPWLVLARLDLRDNREEQAASNVDRALQLEPSNQQGQALKRAVAAKLAEKGQPLQNP